ncbi:MAG: hypothetical protein HKN22_07580 [Bacteroidia bacterium]|nr:hypothetical protein [Bacteroidia bacterium]
MAGLISKILNVISRKLQGSSNTLSLRAKPDKLRSLLVYGWTGSGSTLVCQIGDQLGLKVTKLHGYHIDNANLIKLFMIRDPRDVISSNARREARQIYETDGIIPAMTFELEKFVRMGYKGDYYKAVEDPSTLIIKYEEFVRGKEQELIKFLAAQYSISVSEEKISSILQETSIDKNIERAKKIESFDDYDKKSLIHGNHITNKGASGKWKEDMDQEFRKLLDSKIGDLVIDSGYEVNNDWVNSKTN